MAEGDLSRSYKISPELELPPLRSLDDFILSSARFQLPQFNDVARWSNRIVCNLLYYQTNYFAVMAILFLFIFLTNSNHVILGAVGITIAIAVFYYVTTTNVNVVAFKKEHPLVSIGIILLGVYLCVYMVNSLVVFVFAMAFPLFITFVHASVRMRNMKNKIANKAEAAGLTKTIMGRVLEALGYKVELIRD